MTITRQPESLCLTGNMASIRVATDTDITMTLTSGGDELLTHTYSPTADNIVDINLRDVIMSLLSCQLSNTSSPYQQTMICRPFTATISDGTDTETVSFKALRAGVDNLSDTVGNFLQHNFLTWQPNVKPVTYYTPEFLTYYAQQQVVVKCLAHIAEGNETTVTLATISADTCVTVPVQYAIIAGLTNALPQWYDVWVETGGGTRLTYKQRYYAQDMRSEQEQWILFENSLGGIDTFRAYGDSDNTAEHTHNVAEIEEESQEYRVDTERKYKKSTGRLDRNERLWLLDFFPSTRKYIYIGQSLRQIVVVESDVNYKASELPSSYTFTYRYADAKPYLNLPRTDVPLEVLDIQVPDVGSFTVAPRLVEFPATPLSDGALFPVQDPYSEEWGTTTFGAIRQIIAAMVSTAEESFAILTHTHLNKSFLDGLSWDSIRNHFAGYFLSKTNADTAQGLITFAAGLVSNAIAWFKQGIKIGSDANSPLGIDAAGNATLNNVTAAQLIASVLKTPGFAEAVGLAGKGFGVTAGQDGRATLQTDDLIVLGRMLVNSMEIREVSYIGGVYLLTPAASTVQHVIPLHTFNRFKEYSRAWSIDGLAAVVGYRLMWKADDGTTSTMNYWQVGDMAFCEVFNIQESGVYDNFSNRRWWRLVTRIGMCLDDGTIIEDASDIDEDYDGSVWNFADVSNVNIVYLYDGSGYIKEGGENKPFAGYEGYGTGSNPNSVPLAGDKAVCLGSQLQATRRGAVQIKATGESNDVAAAAIDIYDSINDFVSLDTFEVHHFGKDAVRMSSRRFEWTTGTNEHQPPIVFMGDWMDGYELKSFWGCEWMYNGAMWLCVIPNDATGATVGTENGRKYTTEAPGNTAAWWKEIKGQKGDKGDPGNDGSNGTSPWTADNYNEMDSIACDANGKPVQINGSDQSVSSNFKLFHGSSEEKFYISSVSPSSRTGATIAATPTTKANAATSGSLTVTYNGTGDNRATIDGKDEFTVELTADSDSNIKRQLTFTVNGVRPGADGQPATTYNIKPTVNSISFGRDANDNLTPNSVSFYLECEKSQGGIITNPVISHVGTVLYGTANVPTDADFNPSTAAGHHVAVWGNDLDGIVFNDTYKSIATVPNSFAYNQIYIALFKVVTENGSTSYILLDRETIPIVRDGAKGTDGKDGKDGIDGTDGKDGEDGDDGEDGLDAWTLTVNPSPVIIEQDIYTGNFPFSANNPMYIDFAAKCGNDTATVGTPTNVDNDLNLDVRPDNSGNHRLRIISYSKTGNTYVTAGKITCSVQLSYNGRATTMQVAISVGVTLLGEWETKISDGVETSVATKLGFTDSGGDILPLTQVGQYIRGWGENTSRLTETIGSRSNGNNLFGFSKGIIYDGAVPFVQGYGFVATYSNGYQYGRIYNLDLQGKAGYYVVSCEIKVQSATNINIQLGDQNPVGGSGLVDDNGVKKVPATTSWQKIVAIFSLEAQYAVDSNGALIIRGGSTSNNVFIRYLQIEHGSVPSAFGICAEDEICASEAMPLSITAKEEISYKSGSSIGNLEGLPFYEQQYSWNDDDQNWIDAGGENPYIDLLRNSVKLNLSVGVYTLSFWAKASDDGMSFRSHLYDPAIIADISGVLDASDDTSQGIHADGATDVYLTTTWRKYYIHWYVTSAGARSLIIARLQKQTFRGDNNDNLNGYVYLCGIRFDKGYVTSANRTEYQTVMKQTARAIDFAVMVNSMEKAGIHLYTESNGTPENEAELAKGIIELHADRTIVDNELVVHRLLTGENENEPHVEISGSKALFFGSNPLRANIELVTDDDGCAQLNFYDANGNLMYGLGPSTIFENMNMTKNSWNTIFPIVLFSDYNQRYSSTRIHALAALTASECYQFIEGCKMLGGARQYNIGQPNDLSRPSDFNEKVFFSKNYNSSQISQGYYVGAAAPQMSFVDLEPGEELYSRSVYSVSSAGSVPLWEGTYFYRIVNGNPNTARFAYSDGTLQPEDTQKNMYDYIISVQQ